MINCRISNKPAKKIISYGMMPIANGFLSREMFEEEYFFDLSVAFCSNSMMFQLVEQPDPKKMFHGQYAFFSSTSKKMSCHFREMAKEYIDKFIPNPKLGFVVELGSNDGIMLKNFIGTEIRHLGVEPSSNVAKVAIEDGVNTITEFFNEQLADQLEKTHGKADVISASNVMCHIPDLHSVGRGVGKLLKDSGVFIFEDPYLGDMIQKTSYDQIYDEHVYIFSVHSVIRAFQQHGLEVFDVAPQVTHGGSMRYYLCRTGKRNIENSVKTQLNIERLLGLDRVETYEKFAQNCEISKQKLVHLLKKLKSLGKRVVGYAATSKSTTVLNYCGIGPDLIEYICDTTPIKQGKYSPGMHIPIKSYEFFKQDNPDYAVLFAWNHADEIFEKEDDFLEKGGQWICFVPKVEILQKQGALSAC